MNNVARLYARQHCGTDEETAARRESRDQLLVHYLSMAAAADDHLRALPGMEVPGEFISRDDALAWLDAERTNLIDAVQMAANTGRDQVAMSLPLLLACYFAQRRRFDDLLATTTISLDAARRLGDRHGEADALTNLGGALLEKRHFEGAATAHRDAAAIFRETGDRHGEGDALSNLGVALSGMGRFEEAATAHRDAAAIFRETGDRHGEGKALSNLGVALSGMGRFEEAATAHQDAAVATRVPTTSVRKA